MGDQRKVCVIGDGGWGTALAMVLERNEHDVTVWGPFQENIDRVLETGENTTFLPDIKIPSSIQWTCDHQKAAHDADMVLVVVPSKFYADVLKTFAPLLPEKTVIISATKGLDKNSHKRMSEVAEDLLQHGSVAVLSGPSHAEEVARGVPTAVSIACADAERASFFQQIFSNPTFRTYTLDDVIGVELGGALKNVIAIAAGVSDGIGYGDNTKAALMTRGLAEMARLGCAIGAEASTFSGLSGMGDLVVTCASKLSRNRSVGERLGRGETIDDILDSMSQVAEGVWNCANAQALAQDKNIEVPITDEVYRIIYEKKNPQEAVQSLLTREPRAEKD